MSGVSPVETAGKQFGMLTFVSLFLAAGAVAGWLLGPRVLVPILMFGACMFLATFLNVLAEQRADR